MLQPVVLAAQPVALALQPGTLVFQPGTLAFRPLQVPPQPIVSSFNLTDGVGSIRHIEVYARFRQIVQVKNVRYGGSDPVTSYHRPSLGRFFAPYALVGRPVSDAVFRLVFRMDSRLHPSSLVGVPLNLTLGLCNNASSMALRLAKREANCFRLLMDGHRCSCVLYHAC